MESLIKTDLDAFNYISEQLIKQNKVSMDMDYSCSYRGYSDELFFESTGYEKVFFLENAYQNSETNIDVNKVYEDLLSNKPDLKCAVGHLISDDYYHMTIEGLNVFNPELCELVQGSNPEWKIEDSSKVMMVLCQRIHDTEDPSLWPKVMNENYFSFSSDGKFIGVKDSILDLSPDSIFDKLEQASISEYIIFNN